MTEKTTISDGKNTKFASIIVVISVIIIIISATYLTFSSAKIKDENQKTKKFYKNSYKSLTSEQLKEKIDNNETLIIIDTRSCPCNYNSGHIPTAIHDINPKKYYDYTIDILAYDQDGNHESITFCEKLKGNTYCDIYFLLGGINSWKNADYEIVK